jgi:hypothetical protein
MSTPNKDVLNAEFQFSPGDRLFFYTLAKAMAVTIATYSNGAPKDASDPEELFDRVLMTEMEEEGDSNGERPPE